MRRTPKPWITTRRLRRGGWVITWWLGRKRFYVFAIPQATWQIALDLPWYALADGTLARPAIDSWYQPIWETRPE